MLTKEELPPCPVATCFQLFGNKWKIYIIQQLIEQPWASTHYIALFPASVKRCSRQT